MTGDIKLSGLANRDSLVTAIRTSAKGLMGLGRETLAVRGAFGLVDTRATTKASASGVKARAVTREESAVIAMGPEHGTSIMDAKTS